MQEWGKEDATYKEWSGLLGIGLGRVGPDGAYEGETEIRL